LHGLSSDRLLELLPRRGILIPERSILEFQQTAEAMLYPGGTYMELACERITDEQVQQLGDFVAQLKEHDDSARFYELAQSGRRFHTLLAEATSNYYFADSAKRLHTSLERFTYRAWTTTETAEQSIAEHSQILDALRRRDAALSKNKFSQHADLGRQTVLRILGLGDHAREA
jgi:DNA-binding GntR family transcriptional regulator